MRIGRLIYRVHAIERMFNRGISADDVRQVLTSGETIEAYPDDTPYPSELMLGWCEGRPIHLVAAYNADANETIVITVYEPEPERWTPDFRRRKQ